MGSNRNISSCQRVLVGLALLYFVAAAVAQIPEDTNGLPLKSERTLSFSTSEGTWLSLDVSPDGRTIIFDLLGHLYVLPTEGGEAKQITKGMGFDSQPRYSPDGSMIVFVSDRSGTENLWVARADGSDPRPVTKEELRGHFISPTWARDGEYIIVSRQMPELAPIEIWTYHVAGGSGLQVTNGRPTSHTSERDWQNSMGPALSPDGRYVYCARSSGYIYDQMWRPFPWWQIVRLDRSTGTEQAMTELTGGGVRPLLSHDGSMFVYGTRYHNETGLRLRDLRSGDDRWLKYPIQRDSQESRAERDMLPGYAFTPDDKEIVVSYGGKIHRLDVSTKQDRLVEFTAQVERELGPLLRFPTRVEDGPVRVRLIQNPALSPDGKHLAFSAATHLYLVDLPSGKPRRLTAGNAREFQPAWSSDGKWLAYVTWDHEGGHLWKVRTDGQEPPQQLTRDPAYYREPTWSPDSSRIVLLRTSIWERLHALDDLPDITPPGLELVWVSSEGGDINRIAPARELSSPQFSRDSDRVYLHSSQGLLSMRLDGTDQRLHVSIIGKGRDDDGPEPEPADDIRISPNRSMALALLHHQLYLVSLPSVTANAPYTIDVNSPSFPVAKLTSVGADYFGWAERGTTITWALGSSFFRCPLSSVSLGNNKEKPTGRSENHRSIGETSIDIELPRSRPKGTIVLRGAQVITMRGDELIPHADVVVEENRIARVGPSGSLPIPLSAKVIDIPGMTIIPGIIDLHPHWRPIGRGVLDMENWPFLLSLAYGVTTGRDPSTRTNDMFVYQDLVDSGEMIGPRAYSTGPAMYSDTDLHSLDDAVDVISKYKKYYHTKFIKSYVVGNRRQRQWVVEACKKLEVIPTTEGNTDAKLDLTQVIDGFSGAEHSLLIFPLYKDVIQLMARSGVFYTPTILIAGSGETPSAGDYFLSTAKPLQDKKLQRFVPPDMLERHAIWAARAPQTNYIFPQLAAADAEIIRAGGRVCVSSHNSLQGLQTQWEIWALHAGGVTNFEALRAATLYGAEALGYAQDLGSIEAGKLADLIVLERDPLVDIRNTKTIRYVMKNGELFEADTLNKIWPERKALAPLWWWAD